MVDWREGGGWLIAGIFLARTCPKASNSSWRWVGLRRSRPSLPVRMMAESEGAASDMLDDIDCIGGYVYYLCSRVAGGRRLSAYAKTHGPGYQLVYQFNPGKQYSRTNAREVLNVSYESHECDLQDKSTIPIPSEMKAQSQRLTPLRSSLIEISRNITMLAKKECCQTVRTSTLSISQSRLCI